MGCCFGIVGMAAPRFALFLIWLFTGWIGNAISSWVWSLVGFLFLPFTTLVYVLVDHWGDGVHGFGWFIVGLAFFADLAGYGGSGYYNKGRVAGSD
jgi:hypothetical protein